MSALAATGQTGEGLDGRSLPLIIVDNIVLAVLIVALAAFIFYSQRQKQIILRKNRILARKVELTMHLLDILKKEVSILTSEEPQAGHSHGTTTEATGKKATEDASSGEPKPKTLSKEEQVRFSQTKLQVEKTIREEQLYLREHLTFKDLSAATGISQMHLRTVFGDEEPYMSLNEYVNRRFRIPRVLQMLREHPEYTVEAIARDCGYQNTKTFFNWFHREMGMTPREYCKTVALSGSPADGQRRQVVAPESHAERTVSRAKATICHI